MKTHILYLSLGSNLGDRKDQIERALNLIGDRIGSITLRSSFYETEPWGFHADTEFLNMAVRVETLLSPGAVMQKLLEIEQQSGRNRTGGGYSSRILDVDILFYDDLVITSDLVVIPHARIADRRFVLEPLNEIAPGLIHPVSGTSIRDLLKRCTDHSKVRKIEPPAGNNG